MSSLRVTLLFLVSYATCSWAQTDASLTPITAVPCSGPHTQNVSLYSSDIYTVVSNLSQCSNMEMNETMAFRVFTYANVTKRIVFTARQSSGVVSWTIPLQPTGFTSTFHHVNRTLCMTNLTNVDSRPPLFYVDVFSSSNESLPYEISFEPVKNFSLQLHVPTPVVVGAASPQILHFKLPDNVDMVTIQAQSDSTRCAIVSIQNNTCPANDLLENARSKGVYQTMTTDGFLTIKDYQVTDREFLLVLIATNFSVCHGNAYKPPVLINPPNTTDVVEDQFEQTIFITVSTLPPVHEYRLAIAFPVLVFFLGVYLLFGLPICCCSSRIPIFHFSKCCCRGHEESGNRSVGPGETVSLSSEIEEHRGEDNNAAATGPRNYGTTNDDASRNSLEDSLLETSAIHKPETSLRLPQFIKNGYRKLSERYRVYSWNTITVGIFYGLPAFQLVFSEQQILYASGNEDRCYYNFKCARPLGVLSAFNNVWSNVGYVALGILFFIIVAIRNFQYIRNRQKDKRHVDNHGIPEFFGIYYAMALALFMEGFMSGFYHICPTNANFQFDTAFMFIIGGLILVKVFQNRHPDIHANAFIAFFSFAVVILFTLIGIYFDRQNPLAVRLTLCAIITILMIVFFVSFYHFHQWSCPSVCKSISWENLKHPTKWCSVARTMCRTICHLPAHKVRFVKLLLAAIINLLLAVIVVLDDHLTFATSVLAFFLINVLYFLAAYVLQKFWFKEPWTILPFIFVVALTIFWGGAFYFYFSAVTNWQKTPAESRQLNKDCILLDFYDNHDVWHFLSASAMFCSFMFVLTLDDGLVKTKRDEIHVF